MRKARLCRQETRTQQDENRFHVQGHQKGKSALQCCWTVSWKRKRKRKRKRGTMVAINNRSQTLAAGPGPGLTDRQLILRTGLSFQESEEI